MRRPSALAALLPLSALLLTGAGTPRKPAKPKAAATKPAETRTSEIPADQEIEHTVLAGETLSGIANRTRVPRVLIIEANQLKAPYAVRTGQKLKIPRTGRYTVVRGDTGFAIAYRNGVSWRDIAVANGIDPDKPVRPGQQLLIPTIIAVPDTIPATPAPAPTIRLAWPLAGEVRRGFTPRSSADFHDGLDIKGAEGSAVRAAAAGKVVFAGPEPRQFGNLVVIEHDDGWATAYAFLSRITVKKDEDVRAGERIGLVGHTGLAKGSELHFEVRRNHRPVDPAEELPEAK